jgi:hypothetical protein
MTWNIKQTACAAALLAMVGCDAQVESRDGDGVPPLTPQGEVNGVLLNSFRLNSFRLNSFRLNSFRLNGDPGTGDYIELADIDLLGKAEAEHSSVQGSTLYIETTDGKTLGRDQLAGTIFSFTVQENDVTIERQVRISGVRQLIEEVVDGETKIKKKHKHQQWDDAGSDITLYDLEIRDGNKGKWGPLCVDENGLPTEAVLLTDIWDPETGDRVTPRPTDAVTFACVDAALGKCAVWGYRPWAELGGEPLADYHQACTRLVRADYCGNGLSYTTTGTPIHVLDQLGIEVKGLDSSYAVEAEWGPDGAICLNAENTRLPDQDIACEVPACGADFEAGGLIQSGKIVDLLQ